MEITADLLDRLIDVGNTALNDYYHERACSCSAWPGACATVGISHGLWDTDAFAVAMPALLAEFAVIVHHQMEDQALLASPEVQESLEQLRQGETVSALTAFEEFFAAAKAAPDPVLDEISELTEQLDQSRRAAEVWATEAEKQRKKASVALSLVAKLQTEMQGMVRKTRTTRNDALAEAASRVLGEADRGLHRRYGGAKDYAQHYAKTILAAQTPDEKEEGTS